MRLTSLFSAGAILALVASPALAEGSSGNPLAGSAGTPTQATVSVGTSSAAVLAAGAATAFVKLCVASTAANGIWVDWSGNAAVQAAPSEYIPPGQCDSWVKSTGFLPTNGVNAIASAAVSASLIYK